MTTRSAGTVAPGARAASGRAAPSPRAGATKRPWRREAVIVVTLVAALALVYLANALFSEVGPATVWGLAYGTAAAALMLLTALYGVRRRTIATASRRRLGSARLWLGLHLYGGTAFALLTLMHSGFRVPTGALTWWLWALSLWTAASGLAGLGLQRWLPRVLGSGLAVEVLYERIPELVDDLRSQAEALAADSSEPVQDLYARRVAPALGGPRWRWIYFFDITGGKQAELKEFDYLRRFLPPEEDAQLRRLAQLYKTKLQIDVHYTLQQPLRLWIYLHAPLTLALLVLLGLHLFTIAYY